MSEGEREVSALHLVLPDSILVLVVSPLVRSLPSFSRSTRSALVTGTALHTLARLEPLPHSPSLFPPNLDVKHNLKVSRTLNYSPRSTPCFYQRLLATGRAALRLSGEEALALPPASSLATHFVRNPALQRSFDVVAVQSTIHAVPFCNCCTTLHTRVA